MKNKLISSLIIIIMIFGVIPNSGAKAESDSPIVKDGVYNLAVGAKSNRSIEIAGSATWDNAKVDIWDYGNVDGQKFNIAYQYNGDFYKITSRLTGKSLTVKDYSDENNTIKEGTDIVQSTYTGADSQKWGIKDSKKNGLVIYPLADKNLAITIDGETGKIDNGAKLILSPAENNDNQMFYFFKLNMQNVDDGLYNLAVGARSYRSLEVAGSNRENKAILDIWNYGNVYGQKFYVQYQEEGYYKILAAHSVKALTAYSGKSDAYGKNNIVNNAQIVQYDYDEDAENQKWIIRDSRKNGLVISPLENPLLAITISGNVGEINNGARLILSPTQNNDNQMLYFFNVNENRVKNATYNLAVGKSPNKSLEVAGSLKNNYAKVDIWDYGYADAQKFDIKYIENGYYKITAKHSGKSLTALKDGSSTGSNSASKEDFKAGAEIVQNAYTGADSQKWIIRDSKKNGLVISLWSNPELSITVAGNLGEINNGAKLILSKTENNDNQMLYFLNPYDKAEKEGLYGMSGLMYKNNSGSYLKYYQIGKGKKHLFTTFSIHGFEDGYEKDGAELTYMANQFYDYLKDNLSEKLVSEWTIYVLPLVNPDGQYKGWTNNGPGRTTVYSWAPEHKGIDMNRCYPVGYKSLKTDRNYTGTEPLQAFEAQSLRDFIVYNSGDSNIVIDVHGWLNETIGNNEIGEFYRNEIGITKHIGTYGQGYLIQWARSLPNTKSLLLELPEVNSHKDLLNKKYTDKFIKATMKLLEEM